jgi:prepilin-type N-terminal cleavage/methylation domain-containing protein
VKRPRAGVAPPNGFTLAEMAIVLVIVGLLLGGLIVPLSAQNDLRYVNETQKTLNDIRDALIGYAAANGRLPCPASATTNGIESPAGGGNCNVPTANNAYTGFVPSVTLGIGPTDSQGYAIDAWGNRIHYAITTANGNTFTTTNGMKTATLPVLAPDLRVCADAACVTPLTNAAPGGAVVVIYSTGKNAGTGGIGADEAQNPNQNGGSADTTFVTHPPTPSTAPGGEFDDIVIWLSPGILYNRMIAAGQLP